MPLEEQVASLEPSKRLKELGVPQKSLFYWYLSEIKDTCRDYETTYEYNWYVELAGYIDPTCREEHNISAFTVAELGEILNKVASELDCGDTWYQLSGQEKWTVGWDGNMHEELADTEADARAKMLIYLLENKLITL